MKKLIPLTLLTSVILFGATINIEISNIAKQEGSLVIGLYNSAESFPIPTQELQGLVLDANSTSLKGTFENIPDGVYGIAIYHDENSNQTLDKNFLGIPKEGYGFSNNIKPMFSKPKFEDARFELAGSKTLTIEMNY